MHLEIEKLVAGFARILRAVHRSVSIAQYEVWLVVSTRAQGNTDTRRSEGLVATQLERPQQLLLNLFRDADSITRVLDSVEQNSELVPSETRHSVYLAQAGLQTSS